MFSDTLLADAHMVVDVAVFIQEQMQFSELFCN